MLNSSSNFQSANRRRYDSFGLQDIAEEEREAKKKRATRIAMQNPQSALSEFWR